MTKDIILPMGKVVGIGKLKVFTTTDFPYVIPTLSFIVTQSDDKSYTASCLHLLLDSSADNDKDAVDRLNENCSDFLKTLFSGKISKENAWSELYELVNSDCTSEYWKAYRSVQFLLAEKGIDLKFEKEKFYEKRIQELQNQIEILKNVQNEFESRVVSYQTYGDAA